MAISEEQIFNAMNWCTFRVSDLREQLQDLENDPRITSGNLHHNLKGVKENLRWYGWCERILKLEDPMSGLSENEIQNFSESYILSKQPDLWLSPSNHFFEI